MKDHTHTLISATYLPLQHWYFNGYIYQRLLLQNRFNIYNTLNGKKTEVCFSNVSDVLNLQLLIALITVIAWLTIFAWFIYFVLLSLCASGYFAQVNVSDNLPTNGRVMSCSLNLLIHVWYMPTKTIMIITYVTYLLFVLQLNWLQHLYHIPAFFLWFLSARRSAEY